MAVSQRAMAVSQRAMAVSQRAMSVSQRAMVARHRVKGLGPLYVDKVPVVRLVNKGTPLRIWIYKKVFFKKTKKIPKSTSK